MQEREKEHQLNTKRLREQQIYTQVDHLMHAPFLFHTIFHLDQVYWCQHTELPMFKQNKLVESPLQVNITPKKVFLLANLGHLHAFMISPDRFTFRAIDGPKS